MKLLAMLALLVSVSSAASWDGKKDDLTILTVQLNSSLFGMGVPLPPDFPKISTEIFVASADREVVAFRVTIEYTSGGTSRIESRTVAAQDGSVMALAFFGGVSTELISSVTVVRLREGQMSKIK